MSLLCPIDFRYGRPKMQGVFEEESRLQRLLDVEAALARAEAKVGLIPEEAASEIGRKATTKRVTVKRVQELEEETRHDLMAVVLALTEACEGDGEKYVLLGATSSDIRDPATALQLRDAIRLLEADIGELTGVLAGLASKYKRTVMLGRPHGQAAVPITFGLKMAVFASETARHGDRLRQASPRVVVGKMSGAVGTGAAFGPYALDVQPAVMRDLGVGMEEAATQVVGRDRYAEFIAVLANLAASLEKFCTEVRNLQRTEIGEVAEAFEMKKQVGSSTMAQKENPVASENVCSLSRIVRSLVTPALENVPLWHERDLTNSAAERIILPHACVLIDEMLARTSEVFRTLRVYPDRMKENLEATKGQVMAEAVMIALVSKGIGRQEAHKLVREAAQKARAKKIHLRDALLAEPKVTKLLSKREIESAMDPNAYLGESFAIVGAVVKRVRWAGPSGGFGRRTCAAPEVAVSGVCGSIVISNPTGGFSTGALTSSCRAAGASGPSNKPSSRNHPIESRIDSRIGRYVIPSSRTDFPFSIDAPVKRKSASHDGRPGGGPRAPADKSPPPAAEPMARPPMCRDGIGVPAATLAIRSSSPHSTISPEMMYRSPTRPR